MQDGKTFSEPQLKQVLLQVAQGLEYIHMQGLVHLDIKPGEFKVQEVPIWFWMLGTFEPSLSSGMVSRKKGGPPTTHFEKHPLFKAS